MDPSEVRISNVVATCLFNKNIDMVQVAWVTSGDYSPASFAAVQIRLTHPASTTLVFHSGRLVLTGAGSESSALTAIYVFYRMLLRVHPDLVIRDIAIQNIVASGAFGKCVKLDQLAAAYALDAIFDASLFPGLRLQLQSPPVKILVFSKGRVVLTGVSCRENLRKAWATARTLIKPFLTDEVFSHNVFQVAKNSRKKLRVMENPVDETSLFTSAITEAATVEALS
jgi:transcription initiation factor TFIID TATA-box-binding protein